MRICCFPFLCFGEGEKDNNTSSHYSVEDNDNMEERDLGKESDGFETDYSKLDFGEDFKNVVGVEGEEMELRMNCGIASSKEKKQMFSFEFDGKDVEFLEYTKDVVFRCATSDGRGSEGVRWEVNSNVGLVGGPSSSTTAPPGRGNPEHDSQNKRAKVQSLDL